MKILHIWNIFLLIERLSFQKGLTEVISRYFCRHELLELRKNFAVLNFNWRGTNQPLETQLLVYMG